MKRGLLHLVPSDLNLAAVDADLDSVGRSSDLPGLLSIPAALLRPTRSG